MPTQHTLAFSLSLSSRSRRARQLVPLSPLALRRRKGFVRFVAAHHARRRRVVLTVRGLLGRRPLRSEQLLRRRDHVGPRGAQQACPLRGNVRLLQLRVELAQPLGLGRRGAVDGREDDKLRLLHLPVAHVALRQHPLQTLLEGGNRLPRHRVPVRVHAHHALRAGDGQRAAAAVSSTLHTNFLVQELSAKDGQENLGRRGILVHVRQVSLQNRAHVAHLRRRRHEHPARLRRRRLLGRPQRRRVLRDVALGQGLDERVQLRTLRLSQRRRRRHGRAQRGVRDEQLAREGTQVVDHLCERVGPRAALGLDGVLHVDLVRHLRESLDGLLAALVLVHERRRVLKRVRVRAADDAVARVRRVHRDDRLHADADLLVRAVHPSLAGHQREQLDEAVPAALQAARRQVQRRRRLARELRVGRDADRRLQAAGAQVELLRQVAVVQLAGARRTEHGAEGRQQLQLLRGQVRDGDGQAQVPDAVRRRHDVLKPLQLRVLQQVDPRVRQRLLGNVGGGQRRQHGDVLLAVHLLCELGLRLLHRRLVGARRHLRELLLCLLRGDLVAVRGVGAHRVREAVLVALNVLHQQRLQEVRLLRQRLAQLLHARLHLERVVHVVALHGAVHDRPQHVEAPPRAAARVRQLHLVHDRLDVLLGEAVLGHLAQAVEDELLDLLRRVLALLHALQAHLEAAALQRRREACAARELRAHRLLDELLVQRRVGTRRQQHRQDRHGEDRERVRQVRHPRERHAHAAGLDVLERVERARRLDAARLPLDRPVVDHQVLAGAHNAVGLVLLQALQEHLVDARHVLLHRQVAVRGDGRVHRRVVVAVELHQVLVGQVGDAPGQAARGVAVARVASVDLVHGRPHEEHGRVAVHALHLVEHDAVDRVLAVLHLQAVSLLQEVVLPEEREEGGVEVDVEHVIEVLVVHGGEGVHGAVGVGEGVHVRRQRPRAHLEERVADRVRLAARERRVLEDVRHAAVAVARRAEADAEAVVRVLCVDVHVLGPGLRVLELDHLDVVVAVLLPRHDVEAVSVAADLGEGREAHPLHTAQRHGLLVLADSQ
eukprot:Rhum_TRINITY_DN18693_c0_g1::Rhum_TRINITY_DN18693_c0_g1_i1::g.168119::m.168119